MQVTNNPADIVTDKEMEYLRDANERQTRQFAAIIAERNGRHGVSLVCSILDVSRNTVYRGLHELDRGEHFNEGRVRRKGGGRKSTLSKHPEYITIFREIVEFDIIKAENFTRRKPVKSLPMADCKLRDEQFKIIEEQRRYCDEHGIPVFSVDTKKKELLGPYRHDDGKAYTTAPVKVYDHDYSTFSNGKMVPYGIYELRRDSLYSHPSTEESMRQRQNATHSLKVSVTDISSRTKSCPNGTILSDATEDI